MCRKLPRFLSLPATALALALCLANGAWAVDVVIPDLGSSSSAIISAEQEYKLGQQVLKSYRAQLPTSSDPVLYDYLENLITGLAEHSDLDQKDFDLLVIENPSMNAFAVPGRVIGIHTGLFLYTQSEDQLASVITHELAHVSQRHYARKIEQQKNAALPTLAGILAGIVLAASGGGDAGMAAIHASQAAALESRLRFSRQFEQEADRIGIQNLARAGRDPNAAAQMFELMLRATRYTQRPPEFLLTHPVTESRISDSRARAMKYPKREYRDSLDFHLAAARVRLKNDATPQDAVKRFTSELEGKSHSPEASRYGLALALTAAGEPKQARELLLGLRQQRPEKLLYTIALAQVDAREKNYDASISALTAVLDEHPKDHVATIALAEILMEAGRYHHCEMVLKDFVNVRPKDDYVWYLLAEVYGLTGNILQLHYARAEYFVLNGIYDAALKQLDNALKLSQGDLIATAKTREQIKKIRDLQAELENL